MKNLNEALNKFENLENMQKIPYNKYSYAFVIEQEINTMVIEILLSAFFHFDQLILQ